MAARPGMPSFKVFYGWMKRRPALRAAYAEACDWRAGWLAFQAEMIVDASTWVSFRGDKRRVEELEGRIGRLTPKLHRAAPRAAD